MVRSHQIIDSFLHQSSCRFEDQVLVLADFDYLLCLVPCPVDADRWPRVKVTVKSELRCVIRYLSIVVLSNLKYNPGGPTEVEKAQCGCVRIELLSGTVQNNNRAEKKIGNYLGDSGSPLPPFTSLY